jgi:ubiquinone/menaquinone biosynthesis C-methylase UbiE
VTDLRHPIFARVMAKAPEPAEVTEHRRRLVAGLSGRVVEIGAGHGLNFQHYAETVAEVVAVEPEPYLRARGEEAASAAPVPVRVVAGRAEQLPVGDGEFDAAVASLVLCSVQDPAAALAELRRALRPGGELRFYEHVRGQSSGLARAQRAVDVVWPLFVGGCHVSRDTVGAIERAGFHVERLDRFDFRPCALAWPATPHVLGVGTRA